jgi:hypothetical protein
MLMIPNMYKIGEAVRSISLPVLMCRVCKLYLGLPEVFSLVAAGTFELLLTVDASRAVV